MDKNKNNYHISWIGRSPSVGSEQINYYAVKKGTTTIATFIYDRDYDSPGLSQEQALEDAKWYLAQKCDSETVYDPCRKFKKGDKVRVVEWQGRHIARVGQMGYVVADEKNCIVELAIDGWTKDIFYPTCHLELVTPVEELNPYIVKEIREDNGEFFEIVSYEVRKDGRTVAEFFCNDTNALTRKQAKEGAEAECDRLNAEWRKEQEQ